MKLRPRPFLSKIKSPDGLARTLNSRKKGKRRVPLEKVVFTNGCFDLLHRGHISYLQKARSLGTILVVALNSDESVKAMKGPTRPLTTLANRMAIIASLECVDFVTWFADDTPLALIKKLKPHILVKGGDWKADQIVGSDFVRSYGGRVKSLSFVEGQSTTEIIRRANIASFSSTPPHS